MTRLHREFPDKVRFFDEVIKTADHRFFVRTSEALPVGSDVEVEIVIGSDPQPFVTRGRTTARRTEAGGFDPGVWVQLAAEAVEELRRVMEIREGEAGRTTGRRYPRLRRVLDVVVDRPVRRRLDTVNVSQGGVCLAGLLTAPVGQTVAMSAEMPCGRIPVYGRVAWRREDTGQTGIEFRFQDAATRERILEQVQIMADGEGCTVFAKPSLLVVDDDMATLEVLSRTLGVRGYGTITARSGPEALSLARSGAPALILLDVLLPGMNGLEVCRVLKRDAETSRVPVVLMSALGEQELRLVLEESGALVAMLKPYRFQALETLVEQVLQQRQVMAAAPASPGPPAAHERRRHPRTPIFLRCAYESEDLHTEVYLRDASPGGGFITSCWGDPPGTRAKLVCLDRSQHVSELVVEVVHRRNWGLLQGDQGGPMPGMGVRVVGGPGAAEFDRWIEAYEREMQERPVICVIDDDRSHLEIMSVALRHAGFAVVTLDSPYGAVTTLRMAQPALVIVDFMMPGIDGGKLCQHIKADPAFAGTPVWLYSSLADDRMLQLADECGADGFVRKGLRLAEIVTRVKGLLGEVEAAAEV